jgi:hypothetical protein
VRAGDPESKGGSETTVRLAKRDLLPTHVNQRPAYGSFAELEQACAALWGSTISVGGVRYSVPCGLIDERVRFAVPTRPDSLPPCAGGRTDTTDATVRARRHG